MELTYETEKVKNITVTRAKKQYNLDAQSFLKGEWLEEVRKLFNYDKLDLSYKNEVLTLYFYKETAEVIENE